MKFYVYCDFDSREVGNFCELLGEFDTLPEAEALYNDIKLADDVVMPTRSEEERQYIIGKSIFSEDELIECEDVK